MVFSLAHLIEKTAVVDKGKNLAYDAVRIGKNPPIAHARIGTAVHV
jgi:hypothetical protein